MTRSRESLRSILSPRGRRLVRSYGLVIALAIGFLLLALMVRTVGTTK